MMCSFLRLEFSNLAFYVWSEQSRQDISAFFFFLEGEGEGLTINIDH